MSLSPQTWYQQQSAKLAYRRGLAYARQTSYPLVIAALTQALEQGYPHPPKALVMRGISRTHLKDTAGATADFEAAIQAAASSSKCQHEAAQAHYHRGLLRQQSGNEAGALADWSAAIALSPHYPEPHYQRSLVHLSQGCHIRAIADLDATLKANPTMTTAYLQRGNLRYQLGDIPGAVADWELAVCNDFTLEEAKQNLKNVQKAARDAKLSALLKAPIAAKGLTVQVHRNGSQLDIHIHRQLGTGVNYYTLPDLIREHLVPLHLAEVKRFQLIGHLAEVNRPEWSQSYDLYKGQPCPPSNWQTAFSALLLFPPFGIPAFIQAAQVKRLHERGQYIESLRASKAVKGLCVAGSVTISFFTLLPLGYAAYDSMKETPTFKLIEQLDDSPHRPYHEIWRSQSKL
ncbi:MAG: tetratricopeptide repeat protein [Phormidesmis sp.]